MKVTKSQRPTLPHPELRGSTAGLKFPVFAEVKLDGEFNFLVYKGARDYNNVPGACFLINKYGTVKENFPALNDIQDILDKANVDNCMFACELYWEDGKLGRLYDLLSHKKDDNCKLAVFDICAYNGDFRRELLMDRLEVLHSLGLAHLTPDSHIAMTPQELHDFFLKVINDGYEGVVAKSLEEPFPRGTCNWSKIKYKDQNDLVVSHIDPLKERIEVKRMNGNGDVVVIGVKAANRYKRRIKVMDTVTIEHQGVLASGSLRHPVLIPKKGW